MSSSRVNRYLAWLLVLAFSDVDLTSGSPILHRVRACSKDSVHLGCNSSSALLAVHEATFSNFDSNDTCAEDLDELFRYQATEYELCSEEFKVSINSRCGGRNKCTFKYGQDHLDKTCRSDGVLTIDYACVEESAIVKYCNFPVTQREGYISSPGYPAFFPQLVNCTWSLTAGEGQVISLSVIDLYLRLPRIHYGREICDEALTIYDGTLGGTRIATVCGQSPAAVKTYETTTNQALVTFASDKFAPYRGFLVYYKLRGCPTLPPPQHGYRVYRNGSWALYMCCKGHLFNDTLENSRYIHCVDDYNWNVTVPNCMSFAEIQESSNYSYFDWDWNRTDDLASSRTYWADTNMMADVIIPSALMASLIVGNAVVLIIILRIKRKSKYSNEYYEEDQPRPCSSTEPNHSEA